VTYYLRKFNLVDYTSGEAKIQLADPTEKPTISTVLAGLHNKQPHAQTKPYNLEILLEELIGKLPDAVKTDINPNKNKKNATILKSIQVRMSNKRASLAEQSDHTT
jgi:hypothetical protein